MKKPLEIGQKVEWVSGFGPSKYGYPGTSETTGRVINLIGAVGLEVEPFQSKVREFIHRRQITKVWRKKPKRVAREFWITSLDACTMESRHAQGMGAVVSTWKNAGPHTVRFREVIE